MYNSVIVSILTMLCKHTSNSRTFLSPQKKPISITVIPTHASLLFCVFNLFHNWRKIALQCWVDFCCTTVRISHNYTYITPPPQLFLPGEFHGLYSPWSCKELDRIVTLTFTFHFCLPHEPLSPPPIPGWAPCCIVTSHQLSFLYIIVYTMLMLHSPSPKSHSCKGHMYPAVHCSMIYNSQDVEAT